MTVSGMMDKVPMERALRTASAVDCKTSKLSNVSRTELPVTRTPSF